MFARGDDGLGLGLRFRPQKINRARSKEPERFKHGFGVDVAEGAPSTESVKLEDVETLFLALLPRQGVEIETHTNRLDGIGGQVRELINVHEIDSRPDVGVASVRPRDARYSK